MIIGNKVATVTPFSPSLEEKKEPLPETIDIKEKESTLILLEKKLDEIKNVLSQKQKFDIKVDNTMKYDAFSDYNSTSVNGKEQQAAMNDSSFL